MASAALRISRAAHFGGGALGTRPRAFEKQIGAVGLMDLLVALKRISPSKVLATRWTFVLLVFGVDALVALQMLALVTE